MQNSGQFINIEDSFYQGVLKLIREKYEEKNLTQRGLQRECKERFGIIISQGAISKILKPEERNDGMQLRTASVLCQVLGIDMNEAFRMRELTDSAPADSGGEPENDSQHENTTEQKNDGSTPERISDGLSAENNAEKTRNEKHYALTKFILKCAALTAAAVIMASGGFLLGRATAPAESGYTETLSQATAGTKDEASDLPAGEQVIFKEPLIEKAVRLQLGFGDSQPVYEEHLINVTEIYIVGQKAAKTFDEYIKLNDDFFKYHEQSGNIKSLEDLRALPNLNHIGIKCQPSLSDMTPLSSNLRLNSIYLGECNISDISLLKSFPYLNTLSFSDMPVLDFSCLNEIPTLRYLDFFYMPFKSFEELDMPDIEGLLIWGLPLTSYNGIEKFKNLEILEIKDSPGDLAPLLALPQLKQVSVSASMREYAEAIRSEAGFEIVYID